MDWIHELGPLAFASRLKRLSEQLYRDVALVYRRLETEMKPRWFPLLRLLAERGSLSVTEAAGELKLTHPAVNQIAAAMGTRGLVRSRRGRGDERRRVLSLSAKGRRLVADLEPVWEVIRRCTQELIDESGVDLLAALDRVEGSLERRSMVERIGDSIPRLRTTSFEIVDYRPAYRKWFERLNREWLERDFAVEPGDAKLLADPSGRILRKGGCILFAVADGSPVGTAALLRIDANKFELTKMAVAQAQRRRGIGRALAEAAVARALSLGARTILLHTSPELKPAIRLYRSLGFRRDRSRRFGEIPYARKTIRMVLDPIAIPATRKPGKETSKK